MLRPLGFILLLTAPLLAGCESSIRLPGLDTSFGAPPRSQPVIQAAPAPQVQSAPLAPPVARQDLPPPPGAQALETPRAGEPPRSAPDATIDAPEPGKQATLDPPKPQPQTRPVARQEEPAQAASPTRTSVTGNWTASEASGGSCKVVLSSTPKLDLYNAGTSGCQSKELQRVTAWELRGEEVYLYEPGGAVAARLRATGARKFDGALAKTGAPVSLSK